MKDMSREYFYYGGHTNTGTDKLKYQKRCRFCRKRFVTTLERHNLCESCKNKGGKEEDD